MCVYIYIYICVAHVALQLRACTHGTLKQSEGFREP